MNPSTTTSINTRLGGHAVLIEPWGRDAVRVRFTPNTRWIETPHALLEPEDHAAEPASSVPRDGEQSHHLVNGRIEATVEPSGRVTIRDRERDIVLLRDHANGHDFLPVGDGRYRLTARFDSFDGERLYGMGQNQHGRLNQKGCVLELRQRNAQITIPMCVSSRGYAFLWNHPGTGRACFGENHTQWDADRTPQLDYWIAAADSPTELMQRYAEATGYPTAIPDWALGYWQSKLRYQNQDELLEVARRFAERDLPLSVLVIDYFHWTRMGDWRFDEEDWPDVEGMVAELKAMGVEAAVSVWPMVNMESENAKPLRERGLLVDGVRGGDTVAAMADKPSREWQRLLLYDATHPQARALMWERIKKNYVDRGIRAFWLDACEPEVAPAHHDNLRFHAGRGDEVACRYPLDHQRAFYDGLTESGEAEPLTLCRSAWAGSQRYGALVWSGDIETTWASLHASVCAGLNMALSGIPWWTTDIGGFHGGDPSDPAFCELTIRWFQYATFCPVLRMHGNRVPRSLFSGGPNEPWSYGPEAEAIFRDFMQRRERLRPYLRSVMQEASRRGTPAMRPLWFDAPDDERAWTVEDQFCLGSNILVAPILERKAESRSVYLPVGTDWVDPTTNRVLPGGSEVHLDAPLNRIPVLVRHGLDVPI